MDNQWLLVDTCLFIDYFRKKNKAKSLLYELSLQYRITTSAVSYFELYAGAKERDFEFLNHMFQKIQILPFTAVNARKAAEIYQILRRENKIIEFRDIFIAATAIFHEFSLATLNQKHFQRIPELKLFPV